ncbi:MAG: four helix bundle protein [Chloroflexi bacterium RBG_16_54_18]|nr:MAG: four helix bundle protein [Chloroflexi bacterium RBG_16_54_18]
MDAEELKKRTKSFGIRVIKLVEALPNSNTARIIGNQLLRSGTSIGANYHSALRARSKTDFISKIGIVIEETDESLYWMEILAEINLVSKERLSELMQEANELTSIFITTVKSTRENMTRKART